MDKGFVINNLIINREFSNIGITLLIIALTIIWALGVKLISSIFIEKKRKSNHEIKKINKTCMLYITFLIISIICCYIASPPIIYNFKITNPKTNINEKIKWSDYQELKYKYIQESKENAKNIKDKEIKELIEEIRK